MDPQELAREMEHMAQQAKQRAGGELYYFIVFQDPRGGHNACASNMKPEALVDVLEAFVANLKVPSRNGG